MAQAIQSFFSPAGLGVKPSGAAELFSSEGKGSAFSDVLAGASSRGSGRGDAGKPEPVGRREREQAGGDTDVDRGVTAGAVDADMDAAEPAAADAAADAPAEVSERDRDRDGEGAGQGDAGDAADGAEDGDAGSVEPPTIDAEAGGDAEIIVADAELSQAVEAIAGASVSPVEAADVGQAGLAPRGDRTQQGALDARRGEASAAKLAAQQGAAGEALMNAGADTANPVAPTTASAATTSEDADATPLMLQPVVQGAATAASAETTAATPVTAATASSAAVAQPVTDAAPGPIPVQGGNVSAGAQLAEAHTARSEENAALNNARLARGLASAVNQKGGAVTLRLTPPEMGTVRIQMQLTGTTLAASFHAETASAHALLSQQLGQLRTSLESQGLHVERLSVQPMSQPQQSNNAGNQSDDAQQQNQQPNDGRSRGQNDRGNSESRDARRDGESTRDGAAQQPATFDDHLGSAPAGRNG